VSVGAPGPVITLDDEGLAKLRELERQGQRSATHYRLTMEADGTIVLHPISDLEAAMWRDGLMAKIEGSRAHPERMIALDPDEL
jgi:hypothetical protein